jgi:flagellar basal-body rod modification protein FlgD
MDVTTVPSTTATTAQASVSLDGISGEDFMMILIKQLQYQDPFEPMTNEEMVGQISTIRELEMNTQMTANLQQLTDQQRFGSAASLIGKYAVGEVADSAGNTYGVEGIVTGIRFTSDGEMMLELDTGMVLPMEGLTQVTDPDVLTAATDDATQVA